MLYRWMVEQKIRNTWEEINHSGPAPAVAQALPAMTFRFVGDTALGATLRGKQRFAEWFERAFTLLPTLQFTVVDVVVKGPPWATTAAVRLSISATLADGSAYTNEAVQWVRIRWGRLSDDWVLEDTLALQRALVTQGVAATR